MNPNKIDVDKNVDENKYGKKQILIKRYVDKNKCQRIQ